MTNVQRCNTTRTIDLLHRDQREWSNDEANRRHGSNSADNEALIIVGRNAHRQL